MVTMWMVPECCFFSTTLPKSLALPMVAETIAPGWLPPLASSRASSSSAARLSMVTSTFLATLPCNSARRSCTIAFDSKRDALGWCGLYPASA